MTAPSRNKWIRIESPSQDAEEVVRHVFEVRLALVVHYVPLSATRYGENTEYVHQLRVSCRRASAAVAAMADFLPSKQRRRIARWLKKIRKSANDARDDDVMTEQLENGGDTSNKDLLPLIGRIRKQRGESQRPIVEIFEKAERKGFFQLVEEIPTIVRYQSGGEVPTYGELAAHQMSVVADAFFQAAGGQLGRPHQLHKLRIAGKRLRYSMELFGGAFDSGFRESIYPAVEDLQERLGAINDHATAQSRYQRWIACLPPDAAAAHLAERIRDEWIAFQIGRQAFLDWWSPERFKEFRTSLDRAIQTRIG